MSRRGIDPGEGLPSFSVIVPTRARPADLVACLDSLSRQEYPPEGFEVIVVDDGNPAPIEATTKRFEERLRLRVLRRPHGGPAAARNSGLRVAEGTFVAFTADDCRPRRDWLRMLAEGFRADPDAGIGGRIENREAGNLYSSATDTLLRHLYEHYNASSDRARFFTPNNLAFPLAALREAGGFLDAFETGEDRELCDRWVGQGRRLVYRPEAVVDHCHPLRLGSFLHLHYRYGRGSFRFRREAARRGSAAARREPLAFYVDLIRSPLAESAGMRSLAMAGLLCVAQVANAVGYVRQSLASAPSE